MRACLVIALFVVVGCGRARMDTDPPSTDTCLPTIKSEVVPTGQNTVSAFPSSEEAAKASAAGAKDRFIRHQQEFRADAFRAIKRTMEDGRNQTVLSSWNDGAEEATIVELTNLGYIVTKNSLGQVTVSWAK